MIVFVGASAETIISADAHTRELSVIGDR